MQNKCHTDAHVWRCWWKWTRTWGSTLNTQRTQQNNWWHASKHRRHIHGPVLLSLTSVMCVCSKSGHITHADTTPLSHRHTGRIKRRCARFICRSKAGVWLHQCIISWCFWSTLILTRQAFSNLRWQVYPALTSFKDEKGKKKKFWQLCGAFSVGLVSWPAHMPTVFSHMLDVCRHVRVFHANDGWPK